MKAVYAAFFVAILFLDQEENIMAYTVSVTPLDNEGKTKGIGNIHIGKKLSATVFIKENDEGKLYVQRPGYETKKMDENGKPVWNNFFGMKGEGSITAMNDVVLEEYNKMVIGGDRNKIEDVEITSIEVVNVTPRKNEHNPHERGLATVKVNDEFILNSIKVLEGKYGLYVAFPSSYDKATGKEYNYIEAIADVKKQIDKQVVEAYEKVKSQEKVAEKKVEKEKTKEQPEEKAAKKEEKKTKKDKSAR